MFEERVALSMLGQLGDTSTVGDSGRDYVDVAARLAMDKGARVEMSRQMRGLLSASSLSDAKGYVARFEEALFTLTASVGAVQTI
jgi:predicted O-linked N-acetylglucosamine transferase (SPINDLY family)